MEITIIIDRGPEEVYQSAKGKEQKAAMQSLTDCDLPLNAFFSEEGDTERQLKFKGDIRDFTEAVNIKRRFLSNGKSQAAKKKMNEELAPIIKKSKDKCHE
jgi:hypothetical protein